MAKKQSADPASQADDLISASTGKTRVQAGELAAVDNHPSQVIVAVYDKVLKELKAELKKSHARIAQQDLQIATLQDARVENARLKQANKTKRIIGGTCAFISVLAGGLLKYFPSDNVVGCAIAWVLLIVAAVIAFLLCVFDG